MEVVSNAGVAVVAEGFPNREVVEGAGALDVVVVEVAPNGEPKTGLAVVDAVEPSKIDTLVAPNAEVVVVVLGCAEDPNVEATMVELANPAKPVDIGGV